MHTICTTDSVGIIDTESRPFAPVLSASAQSNHVALLKSGEEAYPCMLEAMAQARQRVFLETYNFADNVIGHRFATTLVERAQAGLDVRLTYDAVGSVGSARQFFEAMSAGGVRVLKFHPIWPCLQNVSYYHRTHRKMLIADETGFVGGLNIAREYASFADGGLGWRDTMVRLLGPVVSDLAHLFLELWRSPQIRPRAKVEAVADELPTGLSIRVLGSSHVTPRCEIAAQYRAAIRKARRTVWIANPYFLPSASFRRALRKAAKRGVDVRIMVPQQSDLPVVLSAAQHFYHRYLRWGIRVFEWAGPMLHAKTAVIDGEWSTVGSFNLDRRSLLQNHEVSAIITGRAFGRQMADMFEDDFRRCRELSLASWRDRGWARRLRERWWALFRTLM